MSFTIAFSGKGGTGKTTLASLCVRYLKEKNLSPILAVDADPNSNLNECLGVSISANVADIRENSLEREKNIPTGMSKPDFVKYEIHRTLVEASGFDLLAMGRPEGPGCYCYANNLIRKFIDQLTTEYKFVIIDTEAGMEHFSRRTTQKVDLLLMVSDYNLRGIRAAGKIKELVKQLNLKIENEYLILNRSPEKIESSVSDEITKNDLVLGGTIPEDDEVRRFDIEGKPLIGLPPDSKCYIGLTKILNKYIK
ncbi:MAG: AAA family ATPase [bacterium]|nr:AAA family ATPase [bacterium]